MKQQYKSGAVAAAPALPAAPSVGNPTEGDVANNVAATVIGAYAFFQIFQELEAVIAAGNLQPAAETLTQVRDAINAMITAAAPDLSGYARLAGDTFTGAVRAPTPAANANNTLLATTAWVRGRLRPRLDSITAAGVEPTENDAGTAIDLNASLAGFTFIELVAHRTLNNNKVPLSSIIPVGEIPSARAATFWGAQIAGNAIFLLWKETNTRLRVESVDGFGTPTVFGVFGIP